MESNNYEHEIELKDLFFEVLRKWRLIVVAAILMAIVLGGYKMVGAVRSSNDSIRQQRYEKDMAEYTEKTETIEREIDNIQVTIDSYNDYIKNSLWFRVNPYEKWVAQADIFINIDKNVQNSESQVSMVLEQQILKAYSAAFNDSTALESYVAKTGIDADFLNELVTVEPDYQGYSVEIQAVYSDASGANKLLQCILDYKSIIDKSIQEQFGEYHANVIQYAADSEVDMDMLQKQCEVRENSSNLAATLQKHKDTLKGLEFPVLESNSSVLKYGILGGIVGAFLAVFLICVMFLMSDRLISAKDLKRYFGVRILGAIPQELSQRAFGIIDRWVSQLENGKVQSQETAWNIIIAGVKRQIENLGSVLIIGTVDEEYLALVRKELSKEFPHKRWGMISNLYENVEAFPSVSGYDGVILVEVRRESQCSEILKEIEILKEMNKEIIGGIIF